MASKLTATDIANIGNQGAVRSSPLRSNFTALKNKINEVIDALAAVAIGTTNAETTAARPYHASLLDRLDSAWKGQYNFVKSGGVVTLNSNPQKVDVSSGEAKVDGADVKWSSTTSGTISYTVSNTRYDVVVANSDSTISIVTGTAHATPKFPALATSQKALAVLLVTTSAVSIFYQMYATMDRDLFDGNHYNTTAVTPYGLKKRQVFTTNGTWTRPIGIQSVHVTLVGAGGAGGAGSNYPNGGGGGGSGQIIKSTITVTADVSITVGATGNTSFGSLATAYAGEAGEDGHAGSGDGSKGGRGANATGLNGYSLTNTTNTDGEYGCGGGGGAQTGNGKTGGVSNNFLGGTGGTTSGGGGGGGGYNSAGANGGNEDTVGANGTGYGAGGGGGGGGSSPKAGGAGGPGICIVEWEE